MKSILTQNQFPDFVNEIEGAGTALCVAAGAGDLEIVKLLLTTLGINANLYDITHATPFCLATCYKHLEVLTEIAAFLGEHLSDTPG
jgi:hypothetical protein